MSIENKTSKQRATKVSKFLSLVLRHEPEKIGITLDSAGWIAVRELLDALAAHAFPVSESELREVVAGSDKQRFAFSDDGQRIRANQGHSVPVELGYEPAVPPEVLHHGTAERFLHSIRAKGLLKGERHHVHLGTDIEAVMKVGERHGRPVLLTIRAGIMQREGMAFYISANGVWLTEHVPSQYIQFPAEEPGQRTLIKSAGRFALVRP